MGTQGWPHSNVPAFAVQGVLGRYPTEVSLCNIGVSGQLRARRACLSLQGNCGKVSGRLPFK